MLQAGMELAHFVRTKGGRALQVLNRRNVEGLPFERANELKAGFEHFLLGSHGKLFAMGSNAFGQAGLKPRAGLRALIDPMAQDEDFYDEPQPMEYFNGVARTPQRTDSVVDVECGNFHSLCLSAKGRVFTWGANYLGHGRLENSSQPLIVSLPAPACMIRTSGNASFAVCDSSKLLMWGCIPGLFGGRDSFMSNCNYCLTVPAELELLTVKEHDGFICNDYGMAIYECDRQKVTFTSLISKTAPFYSQPNAYPMMPNKLRIVSGAELNDICYRHLKRVEHKFPNNGWKCKRMMMSELCPQTFFMLTDDGKVVLFDGKRQKSVELDGFYLDMVSFSGQLALLHGDGKQVFIAHESATNWQLKVIYEFEQPCYRFAMTNSTIIGLIT